MMHFPYKVDAVAPEDSQYVLLRGRRYDREPLEMAWLTLAETGGDRVAAISAVVPMFPSSWTVDGPAYVTAAEGWTGNVVAGEVR